MYIFCTNKIQTISIYFISGRMRNGPLVPWCNASWSSWRFECIMAILTSWMPFGQPIEVPCQRHLHTSTCQKISLQVWMWRLDVNNRFIRITWNGRKDVKFNSWQVQASFGRLLVDQSVCCVPEIWELFVVMHRWWRPLLFTLQQSLGTSTTWW